MMVITQKHVGAVLTFNPLYDELNFIYHFLALLRARPFLHISGVRVKNRASYI